MKNNFQQWSTKSITAKLTCLKVINVSCCFFSSCGFQNIYLAFIDKVMLLKLHNYKIWYIESD